MASAFILPAAGNQLGNLGLAYARLGQVDKAIALMEQSQAIGQDLPNPNILNVVEPTLAERRGGRLGSVKPPLAWHAVRGSLSCSSSRRGVQVTASRRGGCWRPPALTARIRHSYPPLNSRPCFSKLRFRVEISSSFSPARRRLSSRISLRNALAKQGQALAKQGQAGTEEAP